MAAEDATETKVPGDAAKFPGRDWVRSVLGGMAAAEALETDADTGCRTGSLCRILRVTLMSLTFILSKCLEGLKLDREMVGCLLK